MGWNFVYLWSQCSNRRERRIFSCKDPKFCYKRAFQLRLFSETWSTSSIWAGLSVFDVLILLPQWDYLRVVFKLAPLEGQHLRVFVRNRMSRVIPSLERMPSFPCVLQLSQWRGGSDECHSQNGSIGKGVFLDSDNCAISYAILCYEIYCWFLVQLDGLLFHCWFFSLSATLPCLSCLKLFLLCPLLRWSTQFRSRVVLRLY